MVFLDNNHQIEENENEKDHAIIKFIGLFIWSVANSYKQRDLQVTTAN